MFGLGRKKKAEEPVASAEKISETGEDAAVGPSSQNQAKAEATPVDPAAEGKGQEAPVEFSRENGPWDEEEVETTQDYLDFGSMKIQVAEGLNMRLDVEQKTRQMVAVTLSKGKSALQVQAFAAPKSTGIWDDIRGEIADSVRQQGGAVEIRDARLGREMVSRIPAQTKDGQKGFRVARFVGVDGPRWFLRGVFSGEAAIRPDEAREMEDLFKSIVVVRGEEPRPPRELLPMTVPESIRKGQQEEGGEAQKADRQGLNMPQRGPEIAEIR